MEIWCDSAKVEIIKPLAEGGWLKGLTTNPKILSEQKKEVFEQIATLLEVQQGPLAVQVSATSTEEILRQAKKLRAKSTRIIVKIPMIPTGIKALPLLQALGIPTLATAVFGAEQFLLAAKMGANYVAPYLQHMENKGIAVIEELIMMREIKQHFGFTTKILAASVQNKQMIKKLASMGIDAITLKPNILMDWIEEPYSIDITENLNEAWHPFAKEYANDFD